VLHELRVENLLLIERAELRLGPGLNVLTGETGAGKTVLAHALDLLLGGKARPGIVRPGASEAYVEGVFALPEALREELGDRLPSDADELVLARRVSAEGRTRALVNGRSGTAADLRDIGGALLSFYGQHEHRRLTVASSQLDLLDAWCGPNHLERRTAAADAHARVLAAERTLAELQDRAGSRERELDLLLFELGEIEDAAPDQAEEVALLASRERLRHLETLRGSAFGAAEALAPDTGEDGAAALLAVATGAAEGAEGVDPELDGLTVRLRALAVEAGEVAGELRRYGEGLEGEPGELEAAEERLAVLDRLKRKHGGTVEAVLDYAEACRVRRDELNGAEEALEEAQAAHGEATAERASLAETLHATRAEQAPAMAAAVVERLAALGMESATFSVSVDAREPGPTGGDTVEYLLAANPGVPAAPLREIASGGELSRVMLALMGAAAEQTGPSGPATLVFDEVDAGVGGRTAQAVGEALVSLSAHRQVVCITHLPQIAARAGRHFSIEKDVSVEPARTTVRALDDGDVVGELVRMLGAAEDDVAAREHATELLRAA
jgi:DNA repair protein RecN (Recombination protein N)